MIVWIIVCMFGWMVKCIFGWFIDCFLVGGLTVVYIWLVY